MSFSSEELDEIFARAAKNTDSAFGYPTKQDRLTEILENKKFNLTPASIAKQKALEWETRPVSSTGLNIWGENPDAREQARNIAIMRGQEDTEEPMIQVQRPFAGRRDNDELLPFTQFRSLQGEDLNNLIVNPSRTGSRTQDAHIKAEQLRQFKANLNGQEFEATPFDLTTEEPYNKNAYLEYPGDTSYPESRNKMWGNIYPGIDAKTLYTNRDSARFPDDGNDKLQLEHMVPAYQMRQQLQNETGIDPNAPNAREKFREESAKFNELEADMHNITPAEAGINKLRGHLQYSEDETNPAFDREGRMRINTRTGTFTPPKESRGRIARSVLYMDQVKGLKTSDEQLQLMQKWDKEYPATEEERLRNMMIGKVQGNLNPFIKEMESDEFTASLKNPENRFANAAIDVFAKKHEPREDSNAIADFAITAVTEAPTWAGEIAYDILNMISKTVALPGDTAQSIITGEKFESSSLDKALHAVGLNPEFNAWRQKIADATLSKGGRQATEAHALNKILGAAATNKKIAALKESGDYSIWKEIKLEAQGFLQEFESLYENSGALPHELGKLVPQIIGMAYTVKKYVQKKVMEKTTGMSIAEQRTWINSDAGKNLIKKTADRAGLSAIAATEAISNASGVREKLLNIKEADYMKTSQPYRDLRKSGMTHEEASYQLADKAHDFTLLVTGVTAAGISKVVGTDKFIGRMFTVKSEGYKYLSGILGKTVIEGVKGGTRESLEEGSQGGTGRVTSNIAEKLFVDPEKRALEGAGSDTATGVVLGLVAGGGTGGFTAGAGAVNTEKVKERINKVRDKIAVGTAKARITKQRLSGDLDKIYDVTAENYNAAIAVSTAFNEYSIADTPEGKVAALKNLKEHNAHLSQQYITAKDEFDADPNTHTEEEIEELLVAAREANRLITMLAQQQSTNITEEDAASANESLTNLMDIANKNRPPEDIQQDVSAVIKGLFGSEKLEDILNSINEQIKNIPEGELPPELTSITKIIGGITSSDKSIEDHIATVTNASHGNKSMDQVREEVLGVGINDLNKPGLGKFIIDIQDALSRNDGDMAATLLEKMISFRESQNSKAIKYARAINTVEANPEIGNQSVGENFVVEAGNTGGADLVRMRRIIPETKLIDNKIELFKLAIHTQFPEINTYDTKFNTSDLASLDLAEDRNTGEATTGERTNTTPNDPNDEGSVIPEEVLEADKLLLPEAETEGLDPNEEYTNRTYNKYRNKPTQDTFAAYNRRVATTHKLLQEGKKGSAVFKLQDADALSGILKQRNKKFTPHGIVIDYTPGRKKEEYGPNAIEPKEQTFPLKPIPKKTPASDKFALQKYNTFINRPIKDTYTNYKGKLEALARIELKVNKENASVEALNAQTGIQKDIDQLIEILKLRQVDPEMYGEKGTSTPPPIPPSTEMSEEDIALRDRYYEAYKNALPGVKKYPYYRNEAKEIFDNIEQWIKNGEQHRIGQVITWLLQKPEPTGIDPKLSDSADGRTVVKVVYGGKNKRIADHNKGNGILVTRVTNKDNVQGILPLNAAHHFGNVFVVPSKAYPKDFTINTTDGLKTIKLGQGKEATDLYKRWMTGELDIAEGKGTSKFKAKLENTRRDWSVKQLKSGVLKGKKLIYFKYTKDPTHAKALAATANADKDNAMFQIPRENVSVRTGSSAQPSAEGGKAVTEKGGKEKNNTMEANLGELGDIDLTITEDLSGEDLSGTNFGSEQLSKNISWGDKENANLSNLAVRPFWFTNEDGITFKFQSVEHGYQTLKGGPNNVDAIVYNNRAWMKGGQPAKGSKGTHLGPDETWNIKLMATLMHQSFKENVAARQELIDTKDADFTHKIRGISPEVWGEMFPKILMQLRGIYQKTQPADKAIPSTSSTSTGPGRQVTKKGFVVVPNKKPDMVKAVFKASQANKYIGFGAGSTGLYRKQATKAKIPINAGQYYPDDIVFVSINGKPSNANLTQTYAAVTAALEAGATVLTDSEQYLAQSTYNEGEKALAKALLEAGMGYERATDADNAEVGRWTKGTNEGSEQTYGPAAPLHRLPGEDTRQEAISFANEKELFAPSAFNFIHSTNILSKLFKPEKSNPKSLFGKVRNVFSSWKNKGYRDTMIKNFNISPENAKLLTKLISDTAPGETSAESLGSFVYMFQQAFADIHPTNERVPNSFTKTQNSRVLYHMFRNVRGQYPEDLVNATAMSSLNWFISEGSATLTNHVTTISNYIGQDTNEPVSTAAFDFLVDKGSLVPIIAENIGKKIGSQLNIGEVNGIDGRLLPKMEASLGMMALLVLENMGLVEFVQTTLSRLESFNNKPDPDILKKTDTTINFVRITTQNIGNDLVVKHPFVNGVLEAVQPFKQVLTNVFKIDEYARRPQDEPSKNISKQLGRDDIQRTTEASNKAREKAQAVPHVPIKPMHILMNRISREVLAKIQGAIFDIDNGVPGVKRKSQHAANENILRKLDQITFFMQNRELDAEHYYEYGVASQSRHQISSTDVSYQSNKIDRFAFGQKAFQKNYALGAESTILALMQGLGSKLDREYTGDILTDFQKIIDSKGNIIDPVYRDAIDIIRGTEKLTETEETKLLAATEKGKEKFHSLLTLINISAYAQALQDYHNGKNPDSTVFLHLSAEADGLTDGPASGSIQLGPSSIPLRMDNMRAAGVRFEGDSHRNYADWIKNPRNYDNYEALTRAFIQALARAKNKFLSHVPDKWGKDQEWLLRKAQAFDEIMGDIIEREKDKFIAVTSDGRDMNKWTLMPYAYGAGITAVMIALRENRLEHMYQDLFDSAQDPALQARLLENLNVFFDKGHGNISEERHVYFEYAEQAKHVKFNEYQAKYFNSQIEKYIKEPLAEALTQVLGNTTEERQYSHAAIRIMNEIWVRKYYDEITKFEVNKLKNFNQRNKKQKGKEYKERTKILHATGKEKQKIKEDLRDAGWYPTIRFYHSKKDSFEDSLGAVKIKKQRIPAEKEGMVEFTPLWNTRLPNIYKFDVDGETGETVYSKPHTQKKMSIFLREDVYNPVTGVGPLTSLIIGMDSALQIENAIKRGTDNLFDAAIGAADQIEQNSQDMSKDYLDIHSNYSIPAEVQASLARAIQLFNSKGLTNKQRAAINNSLSETPLRMPSIYIQSIEGTAETFDLNSLVPELYEELVRQDAIKDRVLEKIIGVDHFAYGNNSMSPIGEPAINTKEELETTIKRLNDSISTDIPDPIWNRETDIITIEGINAEFKIFGLNNKYAIGLLRGDKSYEQALQFTPDIFNTRSQAFDTFNERLNDRYITNAISVSELNADIKKRLEQSEKGIFGSESLDDNAFMSKYFIHESTNMINATTVKPLFEDLRNVGSTGRVGDSSDHIAFLRKVIEGPITAALNSLDAVTYFKGSTSRRSFGVFSPDSTMYVAAGKGIALFGNEMSPQEIYVHELLHAIFYKALEKQPKFYKEAKRIYDLARKQVKPIHLLHRDADGEIKIPRGSSMTKELADAKKRWDYIFDNQQDVLHEFMAFGLSNQALNTRLGKLENKVKKETFSGSVINRIQQLLSRISTWISESVINRNDKDLADALYSLAGSVTRINNENLGKIDQAYVKLHGLNAPVVQAIKDYAWQPYKKYMVNRTPSKKSSGRILQQVVGLPYNLIDRHWRQWFTDIAYARGYTMDNFVYALIDEIRGHPDSVQPVHDLMRNVKHLGDGMREDAFVKTLREVRGYFDPAHAPTEEDWESISAGILKPDTSALMDNFKIQDIIDVMRDETKLASAISKIRIKLNKNYKSHANYYKKQTNSLGHFMARGTTGLRRQMLNAYNIANLVATHRKGTGDLAKAEQLIEELISLYALKYTDPAHLKVTADFLEHEYSTNNEVNGMMYLMLLHKNFKEEAKEKLFDGNPMQMIKGYTHEMYDEYSTIEIAPKSKTKELEADNYIRKHKLQKDADSNIRDDLYLFVAKDGKLNRYVTGLFSLTDQQQKGAGLKDLYLRKPGLEPANAYRLANAELKEMNKKTFADLDHQFDGTAKLDFKNNWMLPTVNEEGIIADYRYTMSEEHKKDILGKRDQADHVMGRMIGSLIDKPFTKVRNTDVLRVLKADFDANFKNEPRAYVAIGRDVVNKKYREFFRLLPRHTQKVMMEMWKGDTIYIRSDLVRMAFGFRKPSFTNYVNSKFENKDMPKALQNASRITGQMWQGVVASGKRVVVFLMPQVVIQNTKSNMHLLLWKGVPPAFQTKYMLETVQNTVKYMKDQRELSKLSTLLKVKPDYTKAKRLRSRIRELRESINRNPAKRLIDAGLFQNIIEDVDLQQKGVEDIWDRLEQLVPKGSFVKEGIEDLKNMTPKAIKDIFKNLIIHPDTDLGKLLTKVTQFSDFVARAALIEYRTKHEGVSFKEAIREAVETFINYDVPTSPQMQWINDMGLVMYTKFAFRIQRVIFKNLIGQPLTAANLELAQRMLGDVADIIESNLLTKNWDAGMIGSPDRLFEPFGLHAVTKLPDAIPELIPGI